MRKRLLLFLFTLLAVGFSALAQDAPTPVLVAGGLNAPRHLFVDPADGTLFIAEAGEGGDTPAVTIMGDVFVGSTGQITRVTEAEGASVVLPGIFSSVSPMGEVTGAHKVVVTDTTLWVLVGQGPVDDAMPADVGPAFALVAFDRATLEVQQVIDLYANEADNNPDGADVDSNPVDFVVADDGTVYVADAGANAVLRVDADGTVSTFAVWPPQADMPQPVPTSLAFGPDGSLYVGFLTGFPFLPDMAWVEGLDADGNSIGKIAGLTLVTDIEFKGDTLYVVQLAAGFTLDAGFVPNSGSIMAVSSDGLISPAVLGLNFPYGMAVVPGDGDFFFVGVNSTFVAPDSGEVWMVAPGMVIADMPVLPPAMTVEP